MVFSYIHWVIVFTFPISLFYRGKYRIVYLTPEFCSGNLNLLQQLEANIGKWDDRIFISTC